MTIKPLTLALATVIGIGTIVQGVDAQNRPDAPPAGRPAPHSIAAILDRLDTDGDGAVSLSEFVDARIARVEMRFDRRDANGDGLITEDEIGPVGEPPQDFDPEAFRACVEEQLGQDLPDLPAPGERFDEVDANDDGAIDLDEAIAHGSAVATDRFFTLDGDGDGLLTPNELAAARNALRALREARRTCREQFQDMEDLLG